MYYLYLSYAHGEIFLMVSFFYMYLGGCSQATEGHAASRHILLELPIHCTWAVYIVI